VANEIAGLNFISLVILNELIVKHVDNMWYMCGNFRGPMEIVERAQYNYVC
jgi:hypothetical protein